MVGGQGGSGSRQCVGIDLLLERVGRPRHCHISAGFDNNDGAVFEDDAAELGMENFVISDYKMVVKSDKANKTISSEIITFGSIALRCECN